MGSGRTETGNEQRMSGMIRSALEWISSGLEEVEWMVVDQTSKKFASHLQLLLATTHSLLLLYPTEKL